MKFPGANGLRRESIRRILIDGIMFAKEVGL